MSSTLFPPTSSLLAVPSEGIDFASWGIYIFCGAMIIIGLAGLVEGSSTVVDLQDSVANAAGIQTPEQEQEANEPVKATNEPSEKSPKTTSKLSDAEVLA